MRYRDLVSPPIVLLVATILSLAAWFAMPEDVAIAAGISAFAHTGPVMFAAVAALTSFAAGAVFAVFMRRGPAIGRDDSPTLLIVWVKRLTLLACICFALIVALTFVEGGGVSVLLETMRGRRRFTSIEGVTTFVHASTAAAALILATVACYGWRTTLATGRSCGVWALLLLGVILVRAFVGGERVAIYYPLMTLLAVVMVRSHRRISPKAVAGGVLVCAIAAGLFVAGEYFRSYGVKRSDYGLDEGLWSYGLNRLLVYYGASVNTGGAMLEVVNDGHGHEDLFRHTFNPAWKLLNLGSGGHEVSGGIGEMIAWAGLYNPEFNNAWGFAAPFTEGTWVGLIYWSIWGFVATRCWLSAKRPGADAATIAIFGLVTAGLIEAARVNALGTVHLLVPLTMLILVRRSMRGGPATVFSNLSPPPDHAALADPR